MKKYENFVSALANLEDAPNQDLNNDFVQSGLINKFNLQFELSWKLLKRLLEYEGATLAASGSPRAILKESYRFYDFIDEAAWLDMLKDRNTNVHIYDNKLAQDLIQRILNVYIPAFCQLRDGLMERYGELLMAPDDQFVSFLKISRRVVAVYRGVVVQQRASCNTYFYLCKLHFNYTNAGRILCSASILLLSRA